MSRIRKMDNKGFTLVEIMLSIAILALISIPLMKYFSDSLRYAAQTEEKQKATLLAQQTVETIKSQRKIVNEVYAPTPAPGATVGPTTYVISPKLLPLFGADAGATTTPTVVMPSNFTLTGATGTDAAPEPLIYRYYDPTGKYYVETSFTCTTEASSVSSPALLAIDDTRNVVIAERNEEQEAMTFFLSKNLSYYLSVSGSVVVDPDETPTPTPDGLIYITPDPGPTATPGPEARIMTEDELKANMARIIYVTVTKHTGDSYFNVKANYRYFCSDTYGDGSAAGKLEYPTPDLVEANVEHLEGIYLMFNKFSPVKDDIQLFWDVDDTSVAYPDFRFIVQDDVVDPTATATPAPTLDPGATPTDTPDPSLPTPVPTATVDPLTPYSLKVSFLNFDDGTMAFTVHGNLEASAFDFKNISSSLTEPDDLLAGESNRDGITVMPLTGDGIPVRIFDVEVKVYKSKEDLAAGKDPLIALKTSKVE